jgi:hypothetical protein
MEELVFIQLVKKIFAFTESEGPLSWKLQILWIWWGFHIEFRMKLPNKIYKFRVKF